MLRYIVIENDRGLMIAEVAEGESPEDTAAAQGASLVDAGPYTSHQDAYDAMMLIPGVAEEDDTL